MLTLVIQAGGESRRMGQDKALLPFLGQPLIQRVVQRVGALADEVLVTTHHPELYEFLNLPLLPDLIPGRGALGGLYTALKSASQPLVAIIACDMPFASPALFAVERDVLLATKADIAIPHSGNGLEPFHAVYRRETCVGPIEAALQARKWRVDAWFSQVLTYILQPEEIRRIDPQLLCFRNVNTPEELKEAERLAAVVETGNYQ
jgi:molybdopterin-guanine dinucleotide biosynthesis protein A